MSEANTDTSVDEMMGRSAFDDALARAFAKIRSADKDAQNPHFRKSYATLASITDACRDALSSEGFSWPQTLDFSDDGSMVIITTRLRRKGHELASVLPMPLGNKVTPQTIGSAITYGRRYALAAIAGVCPDDDDGQEASKPDHHEGGRPSPRRQSAPSQRQEPRSKPAGAWQQSATPEVIEQYELFCGRCKMRGELQRKIKPSPETIPHIKDRLKSVVGHEVSDQGSLTVDQWRAINEALAADIAEMTAVEAMANVAE